jgi:hypothetical protein
VWVANFLTPDKTPQLFPRCPNTTGTVNMEDTSDVADYYATPAAVIFISIFFPVLGIICVALRFYTQAKAKNAFWWDDWLCIPALVSIHKTFHSSQTTS